MGLKDKIRNAKNTALKAAAEKLFADEYVDKEEAERRLSICEACDRFDPTNRKCLECGCFMDVKTKLKSQYDYKKQETIITRCPLGKWGQNSD